VAPSTSTVAAAAVAMAAATAAPRFAAGDHESVLNAELA
jgi:hypothetical protein